MSQGSDVAPRSAAGRAAQGVWAFLVLILVSSYTATLAATLTTEGLKAPVASAEDLAEQYDIEYGMYQHGTTHAFFKVRPNGVLTRKSPLTIIYRAPSCRTSRRCSSGWRRTRTGCT